MPWDAASSDHCNRFLRSVRDKTDVLAAPTPHEASIEELRAIALPASHPALADELHGVFRARVGVTRDVVRPNACRVMLCATESHSAPPSS